MFCSCLYHPYSPLRRLDGLIPKMNQIYLFCEEMHNFMNSMRDILGMPVAAAAAGSSSHTKGTTDVALMAEIQRIVMASVADAQE